MAKTLNISKLDLYAFFFSSNTRKTYTNAAVSLILILILIIFAIAPTLSTISDVLGKIDVYKAANAKASEKLTNSESLLEQIVFTDSNQPPGLKDQIDFLNNVYMKDASLQKIYFNLHQRANNNNVAIQNLSANTINATTSTKLGASSFDTSIYSPAISSYDLSLVVQSKNLDDLYAFINSLEGYKNLPIFSRIKDISIDDQIDQNVDKNAATKANIISATIDLVIYINKSN